MTIGNGDVDGLCSNRVSIVDIGARLDEESNYVEVPVFCSFEQCIPLPSAAGIHVSAVVQEGLDGTGASVSGSYNQGRPTEPIGRKGRCTAAKKFGKFD